MTPLKGTALQHPERVSLTEVGIAGSRRFHLIDAKGRLFRGPVHGPLVQVEADHDRAGHTLTCRFPDGTVVAGADDALGAACETDFYGRPVAGHRLDGPFDEAFSAFVGQPVFLVRTDRDGDGVDVFPLTVISTASVADLGRRGGYEGVTSRLEDPLWKPDYGPKTLDPHRGAVAVGARPFLVAFNAYLDTDDVEVARTVARRVRESGGGLPAVKALGFLVGRTRLDLALADLPDDAIEQLFCHGGGP